MVKCLLFCPNYFIIQVIRHLDSTPQILIKVSNGSGTRRCGPTRLVLIDQLLVPTESWNG